MQNRTTAILMMTLAGICGAAAVFFHETTVVNAAAGWLIATGCGIVCAVFAYGAYEAYQCGR